MAGTISKINRSVKQLEKELTTIGFHVKIEADANSMTQYLIINEGRVPGITVSDRRSKGKKQAQWAAEVVVTSPTETYEINTYKDPETKQSFTHYVVSSHKANKIPKLWKTFGNDAT
ncbi:hypothetical protein [Marinococcus sp. PL1-022]|uniref:hypothetical protein n=1 Tax=Marinococcus sp. PL1-022 TaxID=3095363 RepID=UPI0029C1A7EF|nr:hypothetical protein [Marinococcus sp. PL1-022]MDX6154509.1 hypothetical protein [Marinococcus sp. PL1-022]